MLAPVTGTQNKLFLAIQHFKNDEVMALLQQCGQEINRLSDGGVAAIHVACRYNNRYALELIMNMGTSVGLADAEGNSPLHHAARVGNLELCKLLVERGCCVAAVNSQRQSAYDVAEQFHSIRQYLLPLQFTGGDSDPAPEQFPMSAAVVNSAPQSHFDAPPQYQPHYLKATGGYGNVPSAAPSATPFNGNFGANRMPRASTAVSPAVSTVSSSPALTTIGQSAVPTQLPVPSSSSISPARPNYQRASSFPLPPQQPQQDLAPPTQPLSHSLVASTSGTQSPADTPNPSQNPPPPQPFPIASTSGQNSRVIRADGFHSSASDPVLQQKYGHTRQAVNIAPPPTASQLGSYHMAGGSSVGPPIGDSSMTAPLQYGGIQQTTPPNYYNNPPRPAHPVGNVNPMMPPSAQAAPAVVATNSHSTSNAPLAAVGGGLKGVQQPVFRSFVPPAAQVRVQHSPNRKGNDEDEDFSDVALCSSTSASVM